MTATVQTQLVQSVLAAGIDPLLQRTPIDATVVPSLSSAGYDVSTVTRAHLQVSMSEAGPRRRHVLSVPTFDALSTYVLTVGGVTFTEATPATLAALMTDMQAQLVSGLPAIGGASSLASDVITMQVPVGAVTWVATAGAPDLLMVSDAESCRARLYGALTAVRYGSLITDVADNARAVSWGLLHSKCGSAVDFNIGSDGLTMSAFPVESIDTARWYLTDVAGNAGDSCTPGTKTVDAPLSLVDPCSPGVRVV